MLVSEMIIYHRLLFIFVISCKLGVNSLVVIYLFTIIIHRLRPLSHVYLQRHESSFIMVIKTGTRKWSRFMAPVSGACVMGVR